MAVDVRASELDQGFRVAALSGRLDAFASEQDYAAIQQALQQSEAGVVIDLADVDFISSAGLRMLLMLLRDAQRDGKHLALIRPQPMVYKIFKVAKLDPLLSFYDSEAAAIDDLTHLAIRGGDQ